MEDILTREQAMAYLGIGKDFLNRLTTTGQIQSHKIGKYRRYRKSHIDQFIRSQEEINLRTLRSA